MKAVILVLIALLLVACRAPVAEQPQAVPLPTPAPEPVVPPEAREMPNATIHEPEPPAEPELLDITLEADDDGFYPKSVITVAKGTHVKLTFHVREKNTYSKGLQIKSKYWDTGQIYKDSQATVEFIATEDYPFASYWPFTNVFKAAGKVDVQQGAGEPGETICTAEQKAAEACTLEYVPVCGWNDPAKIQCIRYPCASTYGNKCQACAAENVISWTPGECPP